MDRPVALITGAARRVGRALALHLAHQGYAIAFTYLNSSAEAGSLVDQITKIAGRAVAIRADLTDLPASLETIQAAMEELGPRLHALIHNASIYLSDEQMDETSAIAMWRIHVETPLLLTRLMAPKLKLAGGCVITLCDILGERPMPGYLTYCASKAGLINLTMGLARELAPEARCCGIAPGVAEWPDEMPEQERQQYIKKLPLGRAGTPEDVARLASFLLTDGRYLTGQVIRLDGGRMLV